MAENRQRKNAFLVRLTDNEMLTLSEKVGRSKLSREAFIRKLIRDEVVHEALPIDYRLLRTDLQKIGTNLNQLAKIANASGMIDKIRYQKKADALDKFIEKLDHMIRHHSTS